MFKKFVKKMLPSWLIFSLRRGIDSVNIILVSCCSKFAFTSSLYYCFFSAKFQREHRAVLLGRLRYYQSLKLHGANRALLRRNIHRLEKGLIMRPRRDVFAEDYIQETVDCYANTVRGLDILSGDHKWAHNVLQEYFSVVKSTKAIDRARAIFSALEATSEGEKYIPYPRHASTKSTVEFGQLVHLFQQRRSVRWYRDRPVETELIEKAVQAASLAPSACNRQPYGFKVINGRVNANRIADCAMGTAGFSHNIPCIIAVVGDLSSYPAERDRHVIYIDGSLAAMQLMLAFETLGLSTCPINWPDIEVREKRLSQELKLQYHERPVMLLAVGYADPMGAIPYSQKKSSEELIYSY